MLYGSGFQSGRYRSWEHWEDVSGVKETGQQAAGRSVNNGSITFDSFPWRVNRCFLVSQSQHIHQQKI